MAEPIVKWAGGKRQLLAQYQEHFPTEIPGRFIDPMVGGGAIPFTWSDRWNGGMLLGDTNAALMDLYRGVSYHDDYERLGEALLILAESYNGLPEAGKPQFYYSVRERFNRTQYMGGPNPPIVMTHADFIFLNRVGFNGLWRVNASGKNNVPWGKKKWFNVAPVINRLPALHVALQDTQFFTGDLGAMLQKWSPYPGDLVYFDPPYDSEEGKGFTSFNAGKFGRVEQVRVADWAVWCADRGAIVRASNAGTTFIRELWELRGFQVVPLAGRRAINSDGGRRGAVGEYLMKRNG